MKALLICPAERLEVSALSESVPLSNLPILGKSLLEYWMEDLSVRGATEIYILATDRPEQVRALVGDGCRWGVQATVFPEIRELTATQARKRYRGRDRTEWLPAPADVNVVDHLPGQVEYPLFVSYAAWMTALKHALPRAATPERIGLREIAPGVWVGLHARVSTDAELRGPCWIGDDCFVGSRTVVGPNAVLEKGAFVSHAAEISQSIVGPNTYVGENVEVRNSIVAGSTLINWELNSAIKVPEAFLLRSMDAPSHAFRPVGILGRVAGLLALLITLPLAIIRIARAKLRGCHAFRPLLAVRPQVCGTAPVTGDTLVYYELAGTRGWLRRWPQLWNIVRGQFAWVGNRPLNPRQATRLVNDFERLWLTTHLGLLCLADTESGCDVRDEEARAHASYYAAQANWRLDWAIFLRAVFLFVFGISVSQLLEICIRFLHGRFERKTVLIWKSNNKTTH